MKAIKFLFFSPWFRIEWKPSWACKGCWGYEPLIRRFPWQHLSDFWDAVAVRRHVVNFCGTLLTGECHSTQRWMWGVLLLFLPWHFKLWVDQQQQFKLFVTTLSSTSYCEVCFPLKSGSKQNFTWLSRLSFKQSFNETVILPKTTSWVLCSGRQ